MYPTELWNVFRSRQGVLRYQLAQLAERRFELRVVASGPEGRRAADQAAADLVHLLDGAHVAVSLAETCRRGPAESFTIVPLRSARAHHA